MGSELRSIEFDTNNSSIKAKVEYMTVEHRLDVMKSGFLAFLFLKNTSSNEIISSNNATFKLTANGQTRNFISNKFFSLFKNDWQKVGVVVFYNIDHQKVNDSTTKCNLSIKITGTAPGILDSLNYSATVNLDSLNLNRAAGDNQAHPTYINKSTANITLGETVEFTATRDWENVYHKVRYFWGNHNDDYKCLFSDVNCTKASQTSDKDCVDVGERNILNMLSKKGETKFYFNLLKGDDNFSEINRSNEVINKDSETCVLVFESYIGFEIETVVPLVIKGEYLGNRVLLVDVKLPSKYKPEVTPKAIEVINTNDTVTNWGIALQGYSKAKTSFSSVKAISGDNAQIIKQEISIQGGSSAATNEVVTDIFSSSDEKTFKYKATDSRGRTAEATKTLMVHQYFLPEVSFAELYRCDENGAKTDKGRWLWVKPLSYFASCNKNNEVSFRCWWKKTSDETYNETNSVEVLASGSEINASLDETLSYDIKVRITDSLGAYTESITSLTSGRVLLHFNVGGQSMGIGMYNYDPNTCKVGYDFLLGETDINDYIKSYVNDFVIEKGKIENGEGIWLQKSENSVKFSGITWRYEKYLSGKVELWGNCCLPNIKPYFVNANYNYVRPEIPKLNNELLVSETTHDLVFVGGDSDSLALLSKGDTTGFSSTRFDFLFFRIETWTQGSVNPVVNFHITAIPKEE